MLDYKEEYQKWLSAFEGAEKAELLALDEAELRDRFYRSLEFGTGGLRGVMGLGLNRMNKYVVGRATQGLANHIINEGSGGKGVALAYDSRNMSREFAWEAASVLAANGVKAYLFDSLRPTPELSFAVRRLGCAYGIVITASHNPAKYNGYKLYGADGGQITPETAGLILSEIEGVEIFGGVRRLNFEDAVKSGMIELIGETVDAEYFARVVEQCVEPGLARRRGGELAIVYTPLHGSGNLPVRRALAEAGFADVTVVPEQELPDGSFPTVASPNPEEKEGLALAVRRAVERGADLILATDPDGDRVGAAAKAPGGGYFTLTGNQVGVLLAEYILSRMAERGTLPPGGAVVKTIVTTEMARAVCDYYGVETVDVLTGFKYIGEKIAEFEKRGNREFIFGFEESCGYLKGTYARDKDAVVACLLIAEAALYYKTRGLTLHDQLRKLYEKYGCFSEALLSFTLEGEGGLRKIAEIMGRLRASPPAHIGERRALALRDYKVSRRRELASGAVERISLPRSDVLYFELEGGSALVARPSGTEPKIKFYLMCRGSSEKETLKISGGMKKFVEDMMK